jgi:type III restriction enzyme
MTMLELKGYQRRTLDRLAGFFRLAQEHGANTAFVLATQRPYREVPQLGPMPYVCLRVPTGGGKTLMACDAVKIAARDYMQADRAVCLWLVPTQAVRNQTLAALRDRRHPYRQALDTHFSGQVEVRDLTEALYLTRGVLDGATVVVVSTLAALRVEDTEGRKVYESNGNLQHHFDDLHPLMREALEYENDGTVRYSLANVLRLRRPVVIVDEAHNARTPLSFDTLARFRPSCVVEFTATPETRDNPAQNVFASNVLCHVSALELKEAEMIKLPIRLETRAEWKEVVNAALGMQRDLEAAAVAEERESGEYVRPIVLFQAQPRRANRATVTADVLRQTLLEDFRVPAEQVRVATGSERELAGEDLFDRACPVRFVITVQALREGWDCSFAYVLCSVAEQHSATSVEQILGRVLRLPNARRKRREELNRAYAFAASQSFINTAEALRDALVDNGFQRLEARDLVVAAETPTLFSDGGLFREDRERVPEAPNLGSLGENLRGRVQYEPASQTLIVRGGLSPAEGAALERTVRTPDGVAAVRRLVDRVCGRPAAPAASLRLAVPALAVRRNGQLELFEESHFTDFEWDLADCDAALSEDEFPTTAPAGSAGVIDVADTGQVEMMRFPQQLHEQLALFAEPGWTPATLAVWLDRQFPHPDVTPTQSGLFIHRVLTNLVESRGLTVENLARAKFRLVRAVEAKIARHRDRLHRESFQRFLFAPGSPVEVRPECVMTLDEDRYSPNAFYEGGYRFRKHAFRVVGDMNGEEAECAAEIDAMDAVDTWVRNIELRPESSFWMQTATDRFYPDFVVRLRGGRFLVVEYKGEDRWGNPDSVEKRAVGELWEARSSGRCLFVMPRGRDWAAIRAKAVQPA